ncbi:hypothetical protein JCM33374_g5704 [Metschnikowia sp. JCM 33374]|nr:hypothetical protein JCM33374_g5704 [Metschnikowia sp. JCM 33374]
MANLLGLTVKTLFILQLGALCLGNELSLLTGEIDSRFSDLYYSESLLCSQTALQAFISECSVKGADNVSPKLRLQSAVKLSICEFKEANVKYPKSCQDMVSDEEFQICVQEFRESAQLWTTYSGHYRKLRSVCYEEAVPFIRQNILDLFLNVTKIYTDFHSAAMKTSNKANGFQEELLAKFQAIVDLMDQSFVMKERQMEAQEDTFDGFQQSMVQKSKYVEDVWDQVSQDISVNSARVDQDLTAAHEKLQTIFEYIDTQFSRISTANENLAAVHFEASQSISKDLMMLSKNSTNGHLELQETLQGNLDKSLQINHLLHDSQVQIGNIFDSIESESRDIIANITRDLRDEALTIFVVSNHF